MFPSVERRSVFDAYGEHVRVEELLKVAHEAQERLEAEEKKVEMLINTLSQEIKSIRRM